jgi:hypothetical protein
MDMRTKLKQHCLCIEAYLRLTWPFIVLELVLWFFLAQTGQGQDILRSETQSLTKTCLFLFFSAIFAFFVWMLKRTVIERTDNNLKKMSGPSRDPQNADERRSRRYRYNAPAITSVLFLPLLGFWLASDIGTDNDKYSWYITWYTVTFVITTVFITSFLWLLNIKKGLAEPIWFRSISWICGATGVLLLFVLASPILWVWLASDASDPSYKYWQKIAWYTPGFNVATIVIICSLWFLRMGRLGLSRRALISWAVIAVVLFPLSSCFPVTAAEWVGVLGVYNIAFVGFLFLMVFAAFLVLFAFTFPVTLLTTAVALVWIIWLAPIDKHQIRDCIGCDPLDGRTFPFGLDEALRRWNDQNPDDGQPRTMILVAAAGGGSRAGYWTGSVLGTLQDKIPDFQRHLFAVSGVSGGALGAAAFAAALGPDPPSQPRKPLCYVPNFTQSFHDCLTGFLSHDFLGPVLASFLTADLVRRILPTEMLGLDRGAALEKGWESAWAHTFAGPNRMAEAFDTLWKDPSYQVNLMLNGTLAYAGEQVVTDPGERAVTSNLLLEHWANAAVVNPAEHARFYFSTAIDNSTRFPFVEPAGYAAVNTSGEGQAGIVDGGYYDNYGAATLLDLLGQMNAHWKDPSLQNVRLIIIQISSNPNVLAKLDPDARGSCGNRGNSPRSSQKRPDEPSKPSSELLTAYQAAMAAREWSGLAYAVNLCNWSKLKEKASDGTELVKPDVHYFHFGMRDINPPLGWSLSDEWRNKLDGLLQKGSDANKTIANICGELNQPKDICEQL